MKRFLTDIGLGLAVFILVMVAEFLVTLPTPMTGEAPTTSMLNRELLLTAPLALVISAVVALLARTRTPADGARHGVAWALLICVLYLVIGLANGTAFMFATIGMYALLIGIALGPILVGWFRGRSAMRFAR